jgi:anti-anti-sigma factor
LRFAEFQGVLLQYALEAYKELTMTITVEIHGPIANILLSGNVDYSTQEAIQNANHKALSADHVREIHVNFAEVMFVDSSIIRALLILQRDSDAKGKSLVLLNCNDYMREVFEIGGFDKMFTFR